MTVVWIGLGMSAVAAYLTLGVVCQVLGIAKLLSRMWNEEVFALMSSTQTERNSLVAQQWADEGHEPVEGGEFTWGGALWAVGAQFYWPFTLRTELDRYNRYGDRLIRATKKIMLGMNMEASCDNNIPVPKLRG